MDGLAKRALEPVNNGETTFYPDRWVNTYNHWLENIRDWCISRQLKWGHRIPVWHCADCGAQTCATTDPDACATCGSENIEQDPDVMDTWASSWLWPFSVQGWPESSEELDYFYPTHSLVTGADIIFFWVARMVMAGQEFMDKIPFTQVCFNGIVRDTQGRKMSKTLGNSSDPLDVIATYGADALRFTIVYLTPFGQDARFADEACERGRGFCTKIWNANRFLQMSFEAVEPDPNWRAAPRDIVADWILSRLAATVQGLEEDLEGFRMAAAASRVYNFFWGEFCDWYVEFLKPAIQSADEAEKAILLGRTHYVIDACLRVLHPFMPFVTEELWQNLKPREEGELLMAQSWPEADTAWIKPDVDAAMSVLQHLITGIRAVRKSYGLSHNAKFSLYLHGNERQRQRLNEVSAILTRLGGLESYDFLEEDKAPKGCTPINLEGMSAYLDLRGHLDIQAEYAKIAKKVTKLEKELTGIEKRLGNPNFRDKAPAQVVAKVEAERDELNRQIETLRQTRADLQKLEIDE
jgi:valyl-tRNA synthetase